MKQTSERLMPAFFILGLLVLWEGAVRIFGIPLYVLPSPVQVAETLVQELPVLAWPFPWSWPWRWGSLWTVFQ